MSRTFRLRHLPSIRAQKFVNARMRQYGLRRYQYINDIVTKNVFPDTEHYGHWIAYRPAANLADSIEAELVWPVLPMFMHPWVSGHAGVRIKSWYKSQGHRWLRRQAKMNIHREQYDLLPSKMYEAYDSWQYL